MSGIGALFPVRIERSGLVRCFFLAVHSIKKIRKLFDMRNDRTRQKTVGLKGLLRGQKLLPLREFAQEFFEWLTKRFGQPNRDFHPSHYTDILSECVRNSHRIVLLPARSRSCLPILALGSFFAGVSRTKDSRLASRLLRRSIARPTSCGS